MGSRKFGQRRCFYVTNNGRQHTPFWHPPAVDDDHPVSCHLSARICSRRRWPLRGAARYPAGRRSRSAVRGTQTPRLGDRRQGRIFVLESLRRFRRPTAPAHPRSEDNVTRVGPLRLDFAHSWSSTQGGIRASFCGLGALPDCAYRNHLLGDLQIHSCDKQHDRAALDRHRSAARQGLDHPSFRLSRAGEKRWRSKPKRLAADAFASTVS